MENTQSATQPEHSFMLFINGMSPKSTHAVENIRHICDKHLPGRYELLIKDIGTEKALAIEHQIIAIPTLIKINPSPKRVIIGDLSDTEKVLKILDLTI